jgi:hypothetical protein
MLDKDYFDIKARLEPMFRNSLERNSAFLTIVCSTFDFIGLIPSSSGQLPSWGLYYQAKGKLPGIDNYVANITITTNPFITQDGVDEVMIEGLASLKEQIAAQKSVPMLNGGGRSPSRPKRQNLSDLS